jgi:hypothetical protein
MNAYAWVRDDNYIKQEVVDFCRTYLTVNWDAFASDKLCLIINDARYVPNHI